MPEPIGTIILYYSLFKFIGWLVSWLFAIVVAMTFIYLLIFHLDDYQEHVFERPNDDQS